MAVKVKFGETFQPGTPQVLFDAPYYTMHFDAAADGRKFLLRFPTNIHPNQPVHVVLNWAGALKR